MEDEGKENGDRPVQDGPLQDGLGFLTILWRGKYLIVITTAVGIALGVRTLQNAQPEYTAKIVLAPVAAEMGPGLRGGIDGQLLSLAGISGTGDISFERFLHLLKSRRLADLLQRKFRMMQRIMPDRWDEERQQWRQPSPTATEKVKSYVKKLIAWPKPPSSDVAMLADFLQRSLDVSRIRGTHFVEVAYSDQRPDFAVELLDTIYGETDRLMRTEERRRMLSRISFIEEQLRSVSLREYRQSLTALLGDQGKRLMMLQDDQPFIAQPVEPPTVSARPTSPKPKLILAVSAILGFGAGFVILLLYTAWRGARAAKRAARA